MNILTLINDSLILGVLEMGAPWVWVVKSLTLDVMISIVIIYFITVIAKLMAIALFKLNIILQKHLVFHSSFTFIYLFIFVSFI